MRYSRWKLEIFHRALWVFSLWGCISRSILFRFNREWWKDDRYVRCIFFFCNWGKRGNESKCQSVGCAWAMSNKRDLFSTHIHDSLFSLCHSSSLVYARLFCTPTPPHPNPLGADKSRISCKTLRVLWLGRVTLNGKCTRPVIGRWSIETFLPARLNARFRALIRPYQVFHIPGIISLFHYFHCSVLCLLWCGCVSFFNTWVGILG